MENRKEIWKTWWWYHRTHVMIAVAVLAVVLYSFLPNLLAPKADYGLAVISTASCPEEPLKAITERFEELADDVNADGMILIETNVYTADLSGQTEGILNYQAASALDADLVGKMSSLFLLDNPSGFMENTAVSVASPVSCKDVPALSALPLPEGWYFTVRSDSSAAMRLYDAILSSR
ncbi:MAG: hypothetical protein K6C08_03030 [Oscillospiraceae bacterium]|nr:hypothetical protein [Oscillospiraceae bacterium]